MMFMFILKLLVVNLNLKIEKEGWEIYMPIMNKQFENYQNNNMSLIAMHYEGVNTLILYE